MSVFSRGFRAMLPITVGVIPFGAVMGTVASEAQLSFSQSTWMNIFVFAGAAQLAAVDLMTKDTSSFVVVLTGIIINLRFLLYSAALSPILQSSKLLTKFICSYAITDQNYAVMSAHQSKLRNHQEYITFYLGASLCMFLAWQLSVAAGFVFGNFAPASWSLDYAISLSFVSLVLPTMKDRRYIAVAIFSSVVSLLLHPVPYRLGLILAALLGIGLGVLLSKKKMAT